MQCVISPVTDAAITADQGLGDQWATAEKTEVWWPLASLHSLV